MMKLMKHLKRMGVFMLTLALMVMAFPFSALAANVDATGRDLDEDVSLTLYKYVTPDNPTTTYTADGTEQTGITADADYVPIEDVVFKIELVTLKSGANATSILPNDYEAVTGADAFSTTGTTDAAGKLVFSTSGSSNTSTATDVLPGQGIYKVTEISGPDTSVTFIVSLPMTNPVGGSWMYDVFAYPKNDLELSVDKEYVGNTGTTADGNVLKWEISAPIPEGIEVDGSGSTGDAELIFTDPLDYRLAYQTGTITGVYTDAAGTESALDLSTDGGTTGDYALTLTSSTDTNSNAIQVMIIEFTEAGLKKLAAAKAVTGTGTPKVIFNFDTKDVMENSVNVGDIENEILLDYTNSAGYVYDQTKDKDDTDLYGIKIAKTNVNKEALAGATFKIYTKLDGSGAVDPTSVLINPNTATDWTVTTGSDGFGYIYGLVEGTYYLVETAAPSGYNLLTSPITVVVDSTTADTTTHLTDVNVTNVKGFILPITGGTGTILFTVTGLILIAAAGVFLVAYKKKKVNLKTDV